jgi:predicted aspartyl protease
MLAAAPPPSFARRRPLLGLAAARGRPALGQAEGASESLRQSGAIMTVTMGQASAVADGLRREGLDPAGPRELRALIDTGASITGVNLGVAERMGLVQTGMTNIGGVTGTSQQPVYAASISLGGAALDPVTVVGLEVGGGFDVLVGRDVLRELVLHYDGLRGEVTLAGAGRGAPTAIKALAGALAAAAVAGVAWALGLLGGRR